MNKLIIIDGYSLLFRAYYATSYKGEDTILRTSTGIPTNAILTFAKMVLPLVESLKENDSICVCLDTGKKTFRHDILPDYKGGRKPTPESLKIQMPILREFLDDFSIPHLEIENYEADDIAGSLASQNYKDHIVEIYTSDKDYLQLVNENISVNLLKSGMKDLNRVTIDNFVEKFAITPSQVTDFKGLFGDTSDNLKGIEGIGEKRALTLIQKYGSIENIIEHANELTPAQKEAILTHKDEGLLCKSLATINKNINLNITNNDLIFKGYNIDKIGDFIKKYEMNTLTKNLKKYNQLLSEIKKSKEEIKIDYLEELEPINEKYLGFAVDFNYKDNYHLCDINGFSLFYNNKLFYIEKEKALNNDLFINLIKDNSINKCCYYSKSIQYILKRFNKDFNNTYIDYYLISYLLNPEKPNDIVSCFNTFNVDLNGIENSKILSLLIAENSYKYKDEAINKLKELKLYDLYKDIELPLSNVLFNMEYEGFPIEKEILYKFKSEYTANLEYLTSKIYELAGEEFNIASPQQVGEILFNKLGLTSKKKTSTSVETLKYLINEHPIVSLILEYRKYSKLLSTYINGILDHIYDDNKLHCIFNQANTATGRLSSSNPNMQNITVKDNESKEIRKAFRFNDDKYVLLSLDYSQIELRILADISNSKTLIDAFNNDEDIHDLTAKYIFGVDEVSPSQRRQAKAVNFGIIYGISTFGLKEQLGISIPEAKNIITRFYEIYPDITQYLESCVNFAQENGYIKTMFNRIRYIPDINSKEYAKREFSQRIAKNTPIQGSAADLIKIIMIKVFDLLKDYDSCLISQIHDELIFKINKNELNELYPKIKDIMENSIKLKVKLKVDGGVADNWYDIK